MSEHLSGTLHAVTVASGDLEASLAFYRDQLGMQLIGDDEQDGLFPGRVLTLSGGSDRCGLLRLLDVSGRGGEVIREPMRPGPLAFDYSVLDLAAAYEQLSQAGYEFLSPPQDVGNVDICFCFAPDRVMTALIQFPADHALRRADRPYVGIINVAQIVGDMDVDSEFWQGVLGLVRSLDYVQHDDSERTERLRRAAGFPRQIPIHMVNLTEQVVDGFQGGGTVELIQGHTEVPEPLGERAEPPQRGYFLTTLWHDDAAGVYERCREQGHPLLMPLADGRFVTRSPSGALVEIVQR
jgi:catechol 2,3-dioxygenase-like lactoylglutathione lyase family enzyme